MGILNMFKEVNPQRLEKFSLDYLVELSDNQLELEYKFLEVDLERITEAASAIMSVMEIRGGKLPTGQLKRLATKISKEVEPEPDPLPEPSVPGHGEHGGVMYVGASPSKLDSIRKKAFTGQIGKTLKEDYEPLTGTDKHYYTNLVPEYVADKNGNPREPTKDEIEKWAHFIKSEIDTVKPVAIVALGKTAGTALGDLANEWVPHPRALRIWGNAGEIERKLSRMAKTVQKAVITDVMPVQTKIEEVPIFKTDEERQIVYGVVMEPFVYDTDKNWSTPDEIEKAAHHFMEWWREHDTEHTKESIDAVPVESWVSPVDMTVNDQPVAKGSWVMGVHIRDEEQWDKVKAGEYAGFSIEAFANIDVNRTLESELE